MQRLFHFSSILLVYILLFTGFAHPNTALTQDLGRHFFLGKYILDTLHVPRENMFSYTFPDFPFINHHYLSEVVFYLISSLLGINSLNILTILVVLIAFSLVFLSAIKKSTIVGLSLVSLLMLRVLFERTDVRPEIFSFLFVSLFISLLYKFREKPTKLIYILIPLSLLWTQMHVYFVVGYGLIALFLLDRFLSSSLRKDKKNTLLLSIVFVGACIITLFNPNGLTGAMYPFRVFNNYGYTIEENQSVFFLESLGFQKPSLPYFKLAVILLFVSMFVSFKRTRFIDWLLAVVFSLGGFLAVRNLPLFAIVCFIPFAHFFSLLIRKIASRLPPIEKNYIFRTAVYISVVMLFLWHIYNVSQIRGINLSTQDPGKGATDFFLKENLQGPIFNNFDIGSYLIYRLYPQERVFIDGRPEAYPSEFIKQTYIPIQEKPDLFEKITNSYRFNTIVFSHTDQTPWADIFLKQIVRNPSWMTVYLDPTMIILVKNSEENKEIINTNGMTFDKLTFSSYDKNDFDSLLTSAFFANRIGQRQLEKKVYQDILAQKPEYCPALYNLAVILQSEQDPVAQLYSIRYQQACR